MASSANQLRSSLRLQYPAAGKPRKRHAVIERGAEREKPAKVLGPEVTICMTINQQKTNWCRWCQTPGIP
ncbi:MAG: hypothetical protein ACUVXF_04345 [Desulfobaccales bacterium]